MTRDPQIQQLTGALSVTPATPSAEALPAAIRIAGIYGALATLYVALSDQLVERFAPDPATLTLLQTYKGILFVLASGFIIGMIVYREVRTREAGNRRIQMAGRQLHQLIENSQDMIILVDAHHRILFTSAATERILGYPPDELVGRLALDFVHPDDRDSAVAAARAALEGEPVPSMELRHRHRNGEWRWLRIAGGVMAEGPAPPRLVLNATDVTDEKRAARERANLEAQLRQSQKMDAIGRLAGGVAHDFNNLLTVISGNVEMLRHNGVGGDEWLEELQDVARAAEAAAELTRHLLAFSRQQVLKPKVLNPNQVVREAVPLLRRVLGPDIDLTLRLGEELGRVEVDPIHLEQVLLNLVLNARDAMPGGGRIILATEPRRIEPGHTGLSGQTAPPGAYIAITVADTGTGMSPDVAERIFEPFFTTKDVGKGTGLGLSTVLGIVQQSGGLVEVDTEPGRGSRFEILLPGRDAPRSVDAEVAPVSDAHVTDTGGVVLLVEDEGAVRTLVKRLLERDGYTVLDAESGPAALDLVRAHDGRPLDLLLTDVVMPQMTGDVLARTVRREHPGLPILFISGYTAEASLKEGLGEEGVDYLAKPFTPAELSARVRHLVAERAQSST